LKVKLARNKNSMLAMKFGFQSLRQGSFSRSEAPESSTRLVIRSCILGGNAALKPSSPEGTFRNEQDVEAKS
jgi:hypothetical protein